MSDQNPETPQAGKPATTPTPLKHLSKALLDQLSVIANEAKELPDAKNPVQALQNLMRAFDKLGIRCSREAVILQDQQKPSQINPLVQVTAINVAGHLKAAARDIEHQPGLPSAWEELAGVLADETKVAKAVQLIISQTGVAATVALPGEPLKDAQGNPLA